MDEVEHLRLTDLNKSIYKKRKQTIERIFADAKEKHGMRWTKYRGLEKSRDAYDASVCCNEFKEISHLAMERQGAFIFLFKNSKRSR